MCALFGDRHGGVETAERVHQSALLRLRTGPDTTLSDRIDLVRCRVPPFSDLRDESPVEARHVLAHLHALIRREACERRGEVRILARLDRLRGDTDFRQGAV